MSGIKKYKYEHCGDSDRCVVYFDCPPTQVEVHSLHAYAPVTLPSGISHHIYCPTHIGWAVVVHFVFMGRNLVMGLKLKSFGSAERLRQRLLRPITASLLVKNATIIQNK